MIRLRLAGLILIASAVQLSAGHELDGRDIAAGQLTYAEHCAACHGANLEGQENWQSPDENGIRPAPPHDANGHTWHHDNQLLFDYTLLGGREALNQRGIQNAPSAMPGFATPPPCTPECRSERAPFTLISRLVSPFKCFKSASVIFFP